MPAAKAETLMVLSTQGVIWLILCKQMIMLKGYNQLRNAPCRFYTDTAKIVHAVISIDNQFALIHNF